MSTGIGWNPPATSITFLICGLGPRLLRQLSTLSLLSIIECLTLLRGLMMMHGKFLSAIPLSIRFYILNVPWCHKWYGVCVCIVCIACSVFMLLWCSLLKLLIIGYVILFMCLLWVCNNFIRRCYICLSEYEEGDKIRILPCHHEFHLPCVDKWLKEIHGYCSAIYIFGPPLCFLFYL